MSSIGGGPRPSIVQPPPVHTSGAAGGAPSPVGEGGAPVGDTGETSTTVQSTIAGWCQKHKGTETVNGKRVIEFDQACDSLQNDQGWDRIG